MEEANRFLKEVFLPAHNGRFVHPVEETGSAFVPFGRHAPSQGLRNYD